MVARGHGLETLALYLALARGLLLDLIVSLGLPTPADRPHRRPSGRHAWQPQDVALFIELWMAGWRASSMAERFGRKPGAIWSKARQLGLPRRDRKSLFEPGDPHASWQQSPRAGASSEKPVVARALAPIAAERSRSVAALPRPVLASIDGVSASPARAASFSPAVETGRGLQAILPVVLSGPLRIRPVCGASDVAAASPALASALPSAGSVPNGLLAFSTDLANAPRPSAPVVRLPSFVKARGRPEKQWTPDADLELSYRHYAFQDNSVAAREMGVSEASYRSRKTRLELPPLPRFQAVPEFNMDWALETIEAYGMKRVRCRAYQQQGVEFWFWCGKKEHRIWSKLAKSKAWFRDTAAALGGLAV